MATRSTIKIEGVNYAKVYKHYEGYPERMTEWLENFNKDFTKNRGNDPSYKFAQLLRHSGHLPTRESYKNDNIVSNYEAEKYLGWGVVEYRANMGEDYEYTLHADGSVTYCQPNK